MRLTLILLVVLSELTMPAAEVAAQDAGENVAAENVAENAPEAEGKDGDKAAEDKGGSVIYFLLFVGFMISLALTITYIINQFRRASVRKRSRLIEAAANELDLIIEPDRAAELTSALSSFPLFQLGINREITNLIVAETTEVTLSIFDYKYEIRTKPATPNQHFWQTVVAIRPPKLQVPAFHLYPEGVLSKIGSALGAQDIDFDDHPEFSNAFVLKSEAEDETREFFDQPVLDFFAQHPDISFEARPGTALYFRRRKRIEPTATALRKFMEEGLQAFHAVRDRDTE